MTLAEIRANWEKKCKPIMVFPIEVDGYQKVYVLLRDSGGNRLHRYMKNHLNDWDVSVDCHSGLDECLEVINQDTDLADILSKFH